MPKLMGSIVLESPLRNVPKFTFGKRVNNVISKNHVQVSVLSKEMEIILI